MEFLKKHLVSLLCGVAGLLFVGLTVFGMLRTNVVEEMKRHVDEAAQIRSHESNPVNADKIAAEKRRGELFKKEIDAAKEVAKEINKREPMLAGVFPEPESVAVRAEFRAVYGGELAQLPVQLVASGLPTPSEIADEAENVKDLLTMEKESAPDGAAEAGQTPGAAEAEQAGQRGFAPETAMGGRGMVMEGMGGGRFGRGMPMGGMGMGMESGMGTISAPAGKPKYDPQFRALVAKAKSIRCYADWRSFHIAPMLSQTNPPGPVDMWKAQVGLWIQQDVVGAIADLNNEFAQQVREGDVYVEQMPVKRVERISVHGYRLKSGMLTFESLAGDGTAASGGGGEFTGESFTGKTSDEQFDVIRFGTTIWVDQRHLPKVIDRICRKNFYKCLELEYRRPNDQEAAEGYMYGTAPVVRARIEFEGYMSRAQYSTLMPKQVLALLGGKKEGENP